MNISFFKPFAGWGIFFFKSFPKGVIRMLVEPAGNDPASGEVRFGFNPR